MLVCSLFEETLVGPRSLSTLGLSFFFFFFFFGQDKGTPATHFLPSLLAQWLVGPCAALKSFLNRQADTSSRSVLFPYTFLG